MSNNFCIEYSICLNSLALKCLSPIRQHGAKLVGTVKQKMSKKLSSIFRPYFDFLNYSAAKNAHAFS